MKAIVNVAAERLELRELPLPEPGPGQVRIRTGACGICATDLAMIAGWARTPFGAIPGHEWSGVVDAVGLGGDPALAGQRCVAENVLADGGEVGVEHPGWYAEYFLTETARLQLLPADFPFAAATLIEPLAVCVRGLRRLGALAPGPVVVLGDGPIGLLLVLLLGRDGRAVTLVGGRASRLDLARELGAVQSVNYHDAAADLGAALARHVRLPVPAVIEASGSAAGLHAALELARGGKILVLGDYGAARADFPWNLVLHRELTLIGSNASAEAWPDAVRLALALRPQLERLVTRTVSAARFAEGLALVRDRRSGAVKIVLQWP